MVVVRHDNMRPSNKAHQNKTYIVQFCVVKSCDTFFSVHNFLSSLMQVEGDLDSLEQALGRKTPSKIFGSGSCSALVKLLPGNKDMLISHDTWGPYNSMLRLFKFYNLPFHLQPGAGMNYDNTYPVIPLQ